MPAVGSCCAEQAAQVVSTALQHPQKAGVWQLQQLHVDLLGCHPAARSKENTVCGMSELVTQLLSVLPFVLNKGLTGSHWRSDDTGPTAAAWQQ